MSKSIWVLRLFFSAASLAWMAFIFQASSSSPQEVNETLRAFHWLGTYRDVVGHLVLYAVLALLLEICIWTWQGAFNRLTAWALVAAAIAIVYGITDEYHQSFVPGRTATALDVLVDSIGALLAVGIFSCLANVVLHKRNSQGKLEL